MVETTPRRNDGGLHGSSDDNSFVMVEHGSTALVSVTGDAYPDPRHRPDQSQPGFFFGKSPVLRSRGDYMVVQQQQQGKHHGMLSTSPGTGGALMGMLMGGRARLTQSSGGQKKVETRLGDSSKLLATAEDVGRRGICVAHLGDIRAYHAMKLIMMNESGSSLLSVTQMEGIEEDARDH
jgi:hypothetical protein